MLSRLGFKKDKERLVKACQNLYDLVYIYVSSTNTLLRILNRHLGTNFPTMSVKEHFSIKENLQLMISALREVRATVVTEESDGEVYANHSLYDSIAGPINSLQDNVARVTGLYHDYKGFIASMLCTIIAITVKNDNFPDSLETAIQQLLNSPALSLHVSELLMDYNDIIQMLQQNETPSTTEGGSSSNGTSQQLRLRSVSSSSSIFRFIQALLQGHRSIKKSLKIAADYLEEAFRVLRPPCEAFQIFAKMVDCCILAITEKMQES